MLKQLITFTNSKEYLDNWHMFTTEVNINARDGEMRMVLELTDDNSENIEETKQVWEIQCEGYSHSKNAEQYKRPYNRIRIYKDHPVFWAAGSEQPYSVTGPCDNITGLMGDLWISHIKACGNWVDFHRIYTGLSATLASTKKQPRTIPEKLMEYCFEAFEKYNVKYSLDEFVRREQDHSVLLFSNPDFCPDDYYFNQPYIVAKSFKEKLL
jgi:hypothetical protein